MDITLGFVVFFKKELERMKVSLPDSEIEKFISLFKIRVYKKNEYLIEVNDTFNLIGFITEGLVRFCFDTFDGKEFNQTFRKEGDIILNYYPQFTGEGSPFFIQALEDTTVFIADYKDVELLYDSHHGWDRMGRKIAEENFMIKTKREAQLLLFDAKDRYSNFAKNFPDLVKRLSQYQVALYLGINPSSLNRIIKSINDGDES
jgi:CRP-like cAMP-binding protein